MPVIKSHSSFSSLLLSTLSSHDRPGDRLELWLHEWMLRLHKPSASFMVEMRISVSLKICTGLSNVCSTKRFLHLTAAHAKYLPLCCVLNHVGLLASERFSQTLFINMFSPSERPHCLSVCQSLIPLVMLPVLLLLSLSLQCSCGATRVWSLWILSSPWGERWSSCERSWSWWSSWEMWDTVYVSAD